MEAEPRQDAHESSEDESDSFDNYGVFQSDYEFKFVQEGTDKTTLMLPPVTYDSMEVNYFNVEIEVDSVLHVSAIEKEETLNGTTRYFFRIAKHRLHLDQTGDEESIEQLGEDGYDYEELADVAAEKAKQRKAKKTRTPMDTHNYSKPKVAMSSTAKVKLEGAAEKATSSEITKVKVEALDGTQIDQDTSGLVELGDAEEEIYDEAEDTDDDGDDDMDDFDETEIAGDMTLGDDEEDEDKPMVTPRRKGQKRKVETSSQKKRRKYDKTNHYSKESSNFSVELTEEGERVYKCDFCSHRTRFAGNMRDHVRIHTGERPFECNVCGKAFSGGSALEAHMVTHTDERKYQCELCGTYFKSKKSVYNHTIQVHKERQFQCHYCEKRFSNNFLRNQHMHVHTGEKKHQCTVCNFSVSTQNSLKRHMLRHTGEQKFQCQVCEKRFNRKEYYRDHMIKSHNFTGEEEFLAKTKRSKQSTSSQALPEGRLILTDVPESEVYTIEEVVMSVIEEEKSGN